MPDEPKKKLPRLDDAEIKRVARGLAEGRIFTASMCPPDMISAVFMPLGLGGLLNYDVADLANVYEWLDKAGERGINGYPIFMSCHPVCMEDWERIGTLAERIQKAVEEAME